MISAVSEASATSTESDSTAVRHWLRDRYFVPVPDLSDETRWEISQGRAWPVFMGMMTLLHDLERRGTEQQQAAAVAGRITHLGVNGLAAAVQMSPTAVLRQLRFLERIGLIRTTQATFTNEVDEATGRIVRNYAKAPPKVIELTLTDRHFRPSGRTSGPRRDTHETNPRRQGDTHETNPKTRNPRVRNECVPRERTSKEVRSSGTNRRQDASGPLGRPETPAAKGKAGSTVIVESPYERAKRGHDVSHVVNDSRFPMAIAEALGLDASEVASTPPGERREELIRRFYAKQGWRYDPQRQTIHEPLDAMGRMELDRVAAGEATTKPAGPGFSPDKQTATRLFQVYIANCAKTLRMTEAEVIELGKADKHELVRRLDEAGADPATGRRRLHRPSDDELAVTRQRELERRSDALEIRQTVTAAVSMHDEPQEAADAFGPADDTPAQQEAAAGLQEALATMTPAGRERARDLGEHLDDDTDAAVLRAAIEAKRDEAQRLAEETKRDLAELAAAKIRQDKMIKELQQGVSRRLGHG